MLTVALLGGCASGQATSSPTATVVVTTSFTPAASLTTGGSLFLLDISCASPVYCVGVGLYESAGGTAAGLSRLQPAWYVMSPAKSSMVLGIGTSAELTSVSCGDVGSCVALGRHLAAGGAESLIAERLSGTTAVPIRPPAATPSPSAGLVSCASGDQCVAVLILGKPIPSNTAPELIDELEGTRWVSMKLPHVSAG